MTAATKIAPRRVADFCGANKLYIVRSDLGLYLESRDFNRATDATVRFLHPDCRGGEHYVSYLQTRLTRDCWYFFIISGDYFRRVTDLSTAAHMTADIRLHEKCRGGDFYLATSQHSILHTFTASCSFVIVFADEGIYRVVSDLSTAENAKEYKLHDTCKGGLYYWATQSHWPWLAKDLYYLVKQEAGELRLHHTKNLGTNERGATHTFHPSVMHFLTMSPDNELEDMPARIGHACACMRKL